MQDHTSASSLDNAIALQKYGVGQPVRRKEDDTLVRGKGKYTDDFTLPGQAYCWMVRSSHAHGIIKGIDAAAAKAMPGVLGVRPALARAYFSSALRLCRLRKVEPSILLHPLDFLGADDVDELAFFPAMGMAGKAKTELVGQFVDQLRAGYQVVSMREHVDDIERRGDLELVAPRFTTEPAGVG